MYKQKNKQRGITLIALVVSIIVLIILAGVSIAMLVGENGIITQAQRADELTTQAQQKEAIELAVASVQVQGTLELGKTKLELALQSQLGDTEYSLTENGDGSFLLQIAERSYYIDSTGEVIAEENMIAIGTAEELKAFRDEVNSGNTYEGKYIYLTGNITLDINEEWEPIGYYVQDSKDTSIKDSIYNENNKPFSGIFDGKDYTVDYMNINNSKNGQGLFGLVINGQIKNINLGENCSLNIGGMGCGGIIGIVYETGKIYNCNNYADMEKTRGGIVGVAIGSITISNCSNYGDLSDAYGGILGSSNGIDGWEEFADVSHTIINCANYGNVAKVSSSEFLGGVVGYFKGTIKNSFNSGMITMNNDKRNVGGIVGDIYGNIANCYNVGNVTGYEMVGGIIGLCVAAPNSSFENCYNIGNIQGNLNIGELIGYNGSETQIINSYTSLDTFTAENLGNAFKEDTNNINNGYPILTWQ